MIPNTNNPYSILHSLLPTVGERPQEYFYFDQTNPIRYQVWQSYAPNVIPDLNKIGNIQNWSLYPDTSPVTAAEARSLGDIQSLLTNNILNNAWTNAGKDPSKAVFQRALLDQDPLLEMTVDPSEVTKSGFEKRQKELEDLFKNFSAEELQSDQSQKYAQKLLKEMRYINRKLKKEKKPFTVADYYRASSEIVGPHIGLKIDVLGNIWDPQEWTRLAVESSKLPFSPSRPIPEEVVEELAPTVSGSYDDIIRIVEQADVNFNPVDWFNTIINNNDQIKNSLLLNYNISENSFDMARNETHAKLILSGLMTYAETQRRLGQYYPTTLENITNFLIPFAQGLVNNLDLPVELGVGLLATYLLPEPTLKTAGAATTLGALARVGPVLGKVYSTAKYAVGIGDMPRYALQYGLLRKTAISATPGVFGGGLVSYLGQQQDIALSNALYFYNPQMKSDFSWGEVGQMAAYGGAATAGFGLLGQVPGIIGTKLYNRRVSKKFRAFEEEMGLPEGVMQQAEKSFRRLYPWQVTSRNISKLFGRVVTEDPLRRQINNALIGGPKPTIEEANAAARTNAEAVAASQVEHNVANIDGIPKDLKFHRADGESLQDFIRRGIRGAYFESALEILNNISPGRNFLSLSNKEKLAVLLELDKMKIQEQFGNRFSKVTETAFPYDPKLTRITKDVEEKYKTRILNELVEIFNNTKNQLSEEDIVGVNKSVETGQELQKTKATTDATKAKQTVEAIFEAAKEASETGTEVNLPVEKSEGTKEGLTENKIQEVAELAHRAMNNKTPEERSAPGFKEAATEDIEEMLFTSSARDLPPKKQKEQISKRLGYNLWNKMPRDKQNRIRKVLQNPSSFIRVARGKKEYIQQFVDTLDTWVKGGVILEADKTIILAATVNLRFDTAVARKFTELRLDTDAASSSVSGAGDVTIATANMKEGVGTRLNRVSTILHEIGHVYMLFNYGPTMFSMREHVKLNRVDLYAKLLDVPDFNKYYIAGNEQELFAEAFSVALLDEVRLTMLLKENKVETLRILKMFYDFIIQSLDVVTSMVRKNIIQEKTNTIALFDTVRDIIQQVEKITEPAVSLNSFAVKIELILKDIELFDKDIQETISRHFENNIAENSPESDNFNSGIMLYNKELFGDPEIEDKFWKEVNRLKAIEDEKNTRQPKKKSKTEEEIFKEAAKNISFDNKEFIPPRVSRDPMYQVMLDEGAIVESLPLSHLSKSEIKKKIFDLIKILKTISKKPFYHPAHVDFIIYQLYKNDLDITTMRSDLRQINKYSRNVVNIFEESMAKNGYFDYLYSVWKEKIDTLKDEEEFDKYFYGLTEEEKGELLFKFADDFHIDQLPFPYQPSKPILSLSGITLEEYFRLAKSLAEFKFPKEIDILYNNAVEAGDMDLVKTLLVQVLKAKHGENHHTGYRGSRMVRSELVGKNWDTKNGIWGSSKESVARGYIPRTTDEDKTTGDLYPVVFIFENPLIIDCRGMSWSSLDKAIVVNHPDSERIFRGKKVDEVFDIDKPVEEIEIINSYDEKVTVLRKNITTDDIARHLTKLNHTFNGKVKYDGIIFKNVEDSGSLGSANKGFETSDVYVSFNSHRVKSLDEIIRDKNGRIIPPSERFDISREIFFGQPEPQPPTVRTPSIATEKLINTLLGFVGEKQITFEKKLEKAGISPLTLERILKIILPTGKITRQNRSTIQKKIILHLQKEFSNDNLVIDEETKKVRKPNPIEQIKNVVIRQEIQEDAKKIKVVPPEDLLNDSINKWLEVAQYRKILSRIRVKDMDVMMDVVTDILDLYFERQGDKYIVKTEVKFKTKKQDGVERRIPKTIGDLEKLINTSYRFKLRQKYREGLTRSGLTESNWRSYIDRMNEGVSEENKLVAPLNYTDEQWLAQEKNRGSMLYQKFEKEFKKSAADKFVVEESSDGFDVVVSRPDDSEKESLISRLDYVTQFLKKQNMSDSDLYGGREKETTERNKWIWNQIVLGKSNDEIIKESSPTYPGVTERVIRNVRQRTKENIFKLLQKISTVPLKDMSEAEQLAFITALIEHPEISQKTTVEEPTKRELLEQEKRSIGDATVSSATQNTAITLESRKPNIKEDIDHPIIAPEKTGEDVTVLVSSEKIPPNKLAPHVTPLTGIKAAEKLAGGRVISSTPVREIKWTTSSSDSYHNSTGIINGKFYQSFKTIEGILRGLPENLLNKYDINDLISSFAKLILEGNEEKAVEIFLGLMKKLNIEGVQVTNPKTGRTLYKFLWDEKQWSYGGITVITPTKTPTTAKDTITVTKKATTPTTEKDTTIKTEESPSGKLVAVISKETPKGKEVKVKQVAPEISEQDRVFFKMSESNEALRDNGTDINSYLGLMRGYIKSLTKKMRNTLNGVVPDKFKEIFLKFVELNSNIMFYNRELFGDPEIVAKFWKEVNRLKAIEDGKSIRQLMEKSKTEVEIFKEAASNVSFGDKKFVPPISHEQVSFRNGEPSFRIIKSIKEIAENPVEPKSTKPKIDKEPDKPLPGASNSTPSKPTQVEIKPKETEAVEGEDGEEMLSIDELVDTLLDYVKNNSAMLLRENNWVSFTFGGSERSNANWWRKLMSKCVNLVQLKSRLGYTTRSKEMTLRFLASWMDDSKTLTSHLVAPGKTPLRTMAQSNTEAIMAISPITAVHRQLSLEAEKLKLNSIQRKKLQKLQIETFLKKKSPTLEEIRSVLGTDGDYQNLVEIFALYRKRIINLNKEILGLEEKTKWRAVVDKDGKPVPMDQYLPILINVKILNEIRKNPEAYKNFISSLVNTRRKTKLNDEMLDENTLVVMGILNLFNDRDLFRKFRKFDTTILPKLSKETLDKLHVRTLVGSTEDVNFVPKPGKDQFIIKTKNTFEIYRIPKKLSDLAEVDKAKYLETVSGKTDFMLDKWKSRLQQLRGNQDLIHAEIKDLLDFKSKTGEYSYQFRGVKNERPNLDINNTDQYFTSVRNFSIEEILSNDDLFEVIRTDMHAAYQDFARYRLFDLKIQETIDKLVGQTGLRVSALFERLERKVKEFVDEHDSIKDKEGRKDDVTVGFTRLLWQIAYWNNTVPRNRIDSRTEENIGKIAEGTVNLFSGLKWGVTQSPELLLELIASIGHTKATSIPAGMFRGLKNLFLFFKRSNSAHRHEIEDLVTGLEDWKMEHSTHFNEGNPDADFDSGGLVYEHIFKSIQEYWAKQKRGEITIADATANTVHKLGQLSILVGGINENTNLTRYYAKTRFVRNIIKEIKSGRLKKFLELQLQNQAEMQALAKEAKTSASAARKLSNMFKANARKAGLNYFEALKLQRVGLDSPKALEALVWGLNHIKAYTNNKVNFTELRIAHSDLLEMDNPPIDPEFFLQTISAFQLGIERLIRKRSVTTGFGLNDVLGNVETSVTQSWIRRLTSYMRSWFDDRMLEIPTTGPMKTMVGGMLIYATLEVIITLCRDWLEGREVDDILTEIEENPYEYVVRFMTRLPIAGSLTPILEGIIRAGSAALDLTKNRGGQRGLDAAISQFTLGGPAFGRNVLFSMARGISTIPEDYGLGLFGGLVNGSQFSVPARLIEQSVQFDENNILKTMLDMTQKNPYPYMNPRGSAFGRRSSSRYIPRTTEQLSFPGVRPYSQEELEALYPGERPDKFKRPELDTQTTPTIDTKGVSGLLGEALENLSE